MTESRLRRSRNSRMFGGVIGGFADYFERDPALLRLIYVLVSIVSAAFPGIFVYLILWAVIPLAEVRPTSFQATPQGTPRTAPPPTGDGQAVPA
ncbi:MAG: PspC domain-containing protein [Thermoanaerobaculia bacterium]